MLRRAENVKVAHQASFFTRRGWLTLTVGKRVYRVVKIGRNEFQTMAAEANRAPVAVGKIGERRYWWFQHRFYWDNDGLSQSEIYALLITRQQRERQRIMVAQATVAAGGTRQSSSRTAIPDDVKQYVWTRDGGRCRNCGSAVELQFDHIIPIALGGSAVAVGYWRRRSEAQHPKSSRSNTSFTTPLATGSYTTKPCLQLSRPPSTGSASSCTRRPSKG